MFPAPARVGFPRTTRDFVENPDGALNFTLPSSEIFEKDALLPLAWDASRSDR